MIFSRPLGLNAVSIILIRDIYRYTFSPPMQTLLQDYVMALFVLCLVVIDVAILAIYTVIEGLRDNLGVKLIVNRERPREVIGVSYYIFMVCVRTNSMHSVYSSDS